MEYTLKRQIFFGLAFFAVLVILVLVSYFILKPEPTCFDNRINQQEEKVDCGGPFCSACKVVVFEDLQVIFYNIFTVGDAYDVVAQVKNINPRHGLDAFTYTFHFYDADGKILTTRSKNTYIAAGQTRYVMENNITSPVKIVSIDFTIDEVSEWQKQENDVGPAALPIFFRQYHKKSSESDFATITGVVENKTQYTFSTVAINVVLVDAQKNPVAIGRTQIRELEFDEKMQFTVLLPHNTPSFSEIYTEAITDVFDTSNIR